MFTSKGLEGLRLYKFRTSIKLIHNYSLNLQQVPHPNPPLWSNIVNSTKERNLSKINEFTVKDQK